MSTTLNATDPAAAGRIQAAMSTTPVVDRAPIPADIAGELHNALRMLCADTAVKLCTADTPDAGSQHQVLLANISVAESLAAQVAQLQQVLWDKADAAGITKTAVAAARGVSQQAVSKRTARTQRR